VPTTISKIQKPLPFEVLLCSSHGVLPFLAEVLAFNYPVDLVVAKVRMHCLHPLMKVFSRGWASPYEVQDCVRKDGMGGTAGGPNPKNLEIGLSNSFIEFPPNNLRSTSKMKPV
jgi:hypothetical protein